MDALWKTAGINTDVEISEDVQGLLVDAALGFLRAGGVLSLADYAMLSAESRAAFQAAQDALSVQQAARIGQAAQGPRGVAAMLAEIDGGDALIENALRTVTNKAVQERTSRKGRGGGR